MSFFNNIKKSIFGYDIFISYSRKDSLDYAYSIAQYFMNKDKGFDCYIDQLSSITPGKELPSNIKDAVKKSSAFVLIGSEGAQSSEAIEQEIQSFLDNNKNKPLIPITIDEAINPTAKWHPKIAGLALIDDTSENLRNGVPSQDVLDRIENALRFTKKSRKLRLAATAIGCISLLLITTALFASQKAFKAVKAQVQAESKLVVADSLARLAEKDKITAEKRAAQSESFAKKSEADALNATEQMQEANTLKSKADSLKRIAERQVAHLNLQSEMLSNRIAAMRYLESDPIIAYRFAEKAYKFEKSKKNRELVLSTLSCIDYYYKSVFNNYQITDFKEPYILLIDNSVESKPNLAVYDMRTSALKVTSLTTDRIAWIIPIAPNSYKILTRNWKGEGSDAIPEYQLWDESSTSIGDKVYGGGMTVPNFINQHTVSIKLSRQPKTVTWDLLTGLKEYTSEQTTDEFGGYFREIYGALDIRNDGVAAAHHDDGLVLISNDGTIDTASYTKVDFDPSSFYSRAEWSPDDSYLALNYFDVKGLGIWEPTKRSFAWLGSPDGKPFNLSKPNHWVINAWNWSQSGHLLAFSGRTENDIDVTVEVVDVSCLEKSREIIYRGNIPIQSISFLPGDGKIVVCDKESNIKIVDISTKRIVGKGQQADVVKSSSLGFYSSSEKDFKSWNTLPSPSRNWFFQSDSTRTYHPEGAVDPSNSWMAVPYFQKRDTTSGIELRNVLTSETKSLNFKREYVHHIEFSNSGKWLVLETSNELNIWNTATWSRYQYPLIQGDRQFIDLEIRSDIIHARLAQDSAGYEIEYLYDLKSVKPNFIKRVITNRKPEDRYASESKKDNIEAAVKGWKMEKPYKYRAEGWKQSGNWSIRLTCRDNPLGASDCDVLFVPSDLEWLMSVYDGLLWKPTKRDLDRLIEDD